MKMKENLGESHGVKSLPVIAERQTAAEDTAVCLHTDQNSTLKLRRRAHAKSKHHPVYVKEMFSLSERDIFTV